MAKSSKKNSLLKLPQAADEIWHVAAYSMRAWVPNEDGDMVRPLVMVVINASTGFVLGSNAYPSVPEPSAIWDELIRIMSTPNPMAQHTKHRPASVFVEESGLVEDLEERCNQINVTVRAVERPDEVNEVFREMESGMMQGPEISGLLDAKGVTPNLVGDLFKAAAAFYRAEPWLNLTDEHPLLVELVDDSVAPEQSKNHVIVMGAAGMEYGLSVYKNWEDLERLFGFMDGPQDMLGANGAHSLMLDEMYYLPFDDLEAIEEYEWEIADSLAYPMPMIVLPNQTVQRPNRDGILWYIAALRAIPAFVKSHLKADGSGGFKPTEKTLSVDVNGEKMQVQITFPSGTLPPRNQRPSQQDFRFDDDGDELILPDRRGMEGAMAQLSGQSDGSPESRAQEIMYGAWEEQNPARRIILAHEALEISPNCADAYVLLAEEEADTLGRALDYYKQGVAAGEQTLGKDLFKQAVGHFWLMMETRPYMRARLGLAETLWTLGKFEEAIGHMLELLHLNPNDNQGVRYNLLNLLIQTENYDDAQELLDEYDDGLAEWIYTEALLGFHFDGDSAYPQEAIQDAIARNEHVPAYLLGRKKLPSQPPPYIGVGDETEAQSYTARYLTHWRKIDGALDWLKKHSK